MEHYQRTVALFSLMDDKYAAHVAFDLGASKLRWTMDPECEGVWGLRDAETGKIAIVFYEEALDFEIADWYEAQITK
ncbi:hypothetical protein SEA_OTTAWA_33 [Arthrobacter phage Ottawa]|nr:hypothetical protein SEA_KHARCHO_33 [Arthrobacter phage Kharcho]WIC89265.1 hypothetical protein SEA_OTTAWA_33 [Arthrobacter phage Ottawa]